MNVCTVNAQEYTITATGTTNPIDAGTFSTVPGGTPFIFTETFDATTTEVTTGTSYTGLGVQNYMDSSATVSASFDGFSYSGSAQAFQVFSGYFGGIYGYEFTGTAPGTEGFAIHLWSPDESVAPDTTLNSIQTSPISDFGPSGPSQNTHVFELNTSSGDIGGVVDDFSVAVSAPEPSSAFVLPLGLATLLYFRYRIRHSSIPA